MGVNFLHYNSSVNVPSSAVVLCPASWNSTLHTQDWNFIKKIQERDIYVNGGWELVTDGGSRSWRFVQRQKNLTENEGLRELVFGRFGQLFCISHVPGIILDTGYNGEQGRQIFTTIELTALVLINK